MSKKIEKKAVGVAQYSYDQLARAERYAARQDVIAALLDRTRTYTVSEVDALIDSFMKGTVK